MIAKESTLRYTDFMDAHPHNYKPWLLVLVGLLAIGQTYWSLAGTAVPTAPSDLGFISQATRTILVALWIVLLLWTPTVFSAFFFMFLGFLAMFLASITEWAQMYFVISPTLGYFYSAERLTAIVFLSFGLWSWSQERRKDDLHLRTLSATDNLTGLYNTRYFYQELENEIRRVRRYNHELALVLIRIDGFQEFNETHGYSEGDRVLKGFGQTILGYLRRSDLGCRFGANEFAILLPETPRQGAELVSQRFQERLEKVSFTIQGKEVFFPISTAVVQLQSDEMALGLVRRAEQQLHEVSSGIKS